MNLVGAFNNANIAGIVKLDGKHLSEKSREYLQDMVNKGNCKIEIDGIPMKRSKEATQQLEWRRLAVQEALEKRVEEFTVKQVEEEWLNKHFYSSSSRLDCVDTYENLILRVPDMEITTCYANGKVCKLSNIADEVHRGNSVTMQFRGKDGESATMKVSGRKQFPCGMPKFAGGRVTGTITPGLRKIIEQKMGSQGRGR